MNTLKCEWTVPHSFDVGFTITEIIPHCDDLFIFGDGGKMVVVKGDEPEADTPIVKDAPPS